MAYSGVRPKLLTFPCTSQQCLGIPASTGCVPLVKGFLDTSLVCIDRRMAPFERGMTWQKFCGSRA